MIKLLDQALKAVRRLPADDQEEIARTMLHLAAEDAPEQVDPMHLTAGAMG
jgi:hypothetical protein